MIILVIMWKDSTVYLTQLLELNIVSKNNWESYCSTNYKIAEPSHFHLRSNIPAIYPSDVVMVEGILVFYFHNNRELFNLKLFVDTDANTRLAR